MNLDNLIRAIWVLVIVLIAFPLWWQFWAWFPSWSHGPQWSVRCRVCDGYGIEVERAGSTIVWIRACSSCSKVYRSIDTVAKIPNRLRSMLEWANLSGIDHVKLGFGSHSCNLWTHFKGPWPRKHPHLEMAKLFANEDQ